MHDWGPISISAGTYLSHGHGFDTHHLLGDNKSIDHTNKSKEDDTRRLCLRRQGSTPRARTRFPGSSLPWAHARATIAVLVVIVKRIDIDYSGALNVYAMYSGSHTCREHGASK